jgi:hypothetical protein
MLAPVAQFRQSRIEQVFEMSDFRGDHSSGTRHNLIRERDRRGCSAVLEQACKGRDFCAAIRDLIEPAHGAAIAGESPFGAGLFQDAPT